MSGCTTSRILAALLLATAAPVLAGDKVFLVTDFDVIEVRGPYRVNLVTGRASSAKASGTREALDRVSIEVQDRTLRIRPNVSAWGGNSGAGNVPLTIAVTTRNLRAATLAGPGALGIDRAAGLRIDLALAGSGSIAIGALAADQLVLRQSGSGSLRLTGKVKQLRASLHGSGDVQARDLGAEDVDLVAGSSGTFLLGSARRARVRAAGIGEIRIGGAPACSITGLGAGNVLCGGDIAPPPEE